jgi:hypothetical protein
MQKLRRVPFGEKEGKSYKWVGGYECNLSKEELRTRPRK